MGRPRAADRTVATTERLLGAAERAFADAGFWGARLEDIAKEAGVRRPSLLYHYGTKRELYDAVVHRVFDDLARGLAGALDEGLAFREQLDRLLAAFVAFSTARPSVPRLILREVLDRNGPGQTVLIEAGVPVLDWVERVIRARGAGELRPEVPIRSALLQLVSSAFVKISSGPLETALWGKEDHTLALARLLLLKEADPCT